MADRRLNRRRERTRTCCAPQRTRLPSGSSANGTSPTRIGERGSDLTGNNRGTGPATSVPRDDQAIEKANGNEQPIPFHPCSETKSGEEQTEWKRHDTPWIAPPPAAEDDDGAEAALRTMFRQKIADLRRLPRHQRAAARWAAKLWLAIELKALREKRARERQGRYMQWRLQNPAPR